MTSTMGAENSFYATLVSGKRREGPSQHGYHVQLAERIHLEGEWEVALTQLISPAPYYTFAGGRFYFGTEVRKGERVRIGDNKSFTSTRISHLGWIDIAPNYYATIDELISTLTLRYREYFDKALWTADRTMNRKALDAYRERSAALRRWGRYIRFSYSKPSQRVIVRIIGGGGRRRCMLDDSLKRALGFERRGRTLRDSWNVAANPPNLRTAVRNLYVHLDVIQPQVVGGGRRSLLKIVQASGVYGQPVLLDMDALEFTPVLVKDFDSLNMDIKDSEGLPIPYAGGPVIAKLLFRRRS